MIEFLDGQAHGQLKWSRERKRERERERGRERERERERERKVAKCANLEIT